MNWLTEGVKALQKNNIIQLFEYCVHLDQDQTEPHFDITHEYEFASDPKHRHPKMWKSFASNYAQKNDLANSPIYDVHGHVGFAWGARREILEAVPLFDTRISHSIRN